MNAEMWFKTYFRLFAVLSSAALTSKGIGDLLEVAGLQPGLLMVSLYIATLLGVGVVFWGALDPFFSREGSRAKQTASAP